MVRVGSLFDLSLISPEQIDNKTGMTPAQQLEKIYRMVRGLSERRTFYIGSSPRNWKIWEFATSVKNR